MLQASEMFPPPFNPGGSTRCLPTLCRAVCSCLCL